MPDVLTATSLQDYDDCAYRYLLRYVRAIDNPTPLADDLTEFEQAAARAAQFRRMAEQSLRGVPDDALLRHVNDDVLRGWWGRFAADGLRDVPATRYPSLTLTAALHGVYLSTRVDLLAAEPGRAVILEWRASTAPSADSLAARVHTAVTRWVASRAIETVAGAAVVPEQLELRYWFAADQSPLVTLPYSAAQQAQDEADLRRLIDQLRHETAYARTTDLRECMTCTYRAICRPTLTADHLSPDTDAASLLFEAERLRDER